MNQSDGGNDQSEAIPETDQSDITCQTMTVTEGESLIFLCEERGRRPLLPTIPEVTDFSPGTAKFFVGDSLSLDEKLEESSEGEEVFVEIPKEPRSVEECLDVYGTEVRAVWLCFCWQSGVWVCVE